MASTTAYRRWRRNSPTSRWQCSLRPEANLQRWQPRQRPLAPKVTTVGFLINPIFPTAESPLSDTQEAARAIGVQLHVLRASTDYEIDTAFESVAQQGISALA